ncbi:hypothetical protein U6V17_12295, partial [Cutibacterium acnes]
KPLGRREPQPGDGDGDPDNPEERQRAADENGEATVSRMRGRCIPAHGAILNCTDVLRGLPLALLRR